MLNKSFKTFLILSILVLIYTQDSSEISGNGQFINHKVGQTFSIKAQNGKMFSAIEIKQLKSKYFFIHVKLDWDSKNIPIKIYVYKEGQGNPIKICEYNQIDACFLAQEQMTQNNNVIVLTDSVQSYYGYTIQTYWSDIQHLQPNSQTKFYFSKNDQTQLYHLQLNSTDFHQLRIIMKPQTVRSLFDKVKIYGSFGTNNIASPQKYDFTSIHLWQDAEGVFLYGKQIKDKNINIFIVGEIQTIYTLSCEILNNTHHDIDVGQTVHQYLQAGQDFLYHAKFDNNSQYDEYLVTFSGFSGQLGLSFFKDKNKTQSLQIQPFQYLSDAQYVFKKSQFLTYLQQGLFIYVHALNKTSVYTISFKGRTKSNAIQLKQSIYEFIQIQSTQNHQLAYFEIIQWINSTVIQDLQYSVSLTNVIGIHTLEFRLCDDYYEKCIKNQTFLSTSSVLYANMTTIGTKDSYLIKISKQNFMNLNTAEKKVTIIIVIKNNDKKIQNKSLVALEYRAENKIQYLREGKPVESKIKQNQHKIFKYTNQDPLLSQVRVFINEISGKIDVFSIRQEPKTTFGKQQTDSIISFTNDLSTKPIFLIVKGTQQAIFSIQVVSLHKSDRSLSAFTLTEDLSFSVKIKPQGYQIIEVVPIYDAIYLQYQASGSILICTIDLLINNCQKDYSPKLSKKGQITIKNLQETSRMFKVMNPFQNQIVKVTLLYHSKDYAHCEQRQLDTLYYQNVQEDQIVQNGNQNNCYHFPILKEKDVIVSLSRIDMGQIHYGVSLCNQIFTSNSQLNTDSFKISYQKIRSSCLSSPQKYMTLMISPHKKKQQINKVIVPYKIKYLIQYADQKVITIPDGISYEFQAKSTQQPIKIFYYDLINIKNTTIKLIQDVGYGSFTVKIAETAKKQRALNENNYDYIFSKSDSYFLNPTLTITKEQILKANCKQCSLIIKVLSNEQIGSRVKFGIQVTQNHIQLQDHQPKQSFLSKNSFDFYTYTTLAQKSIGSLIVQVYDNNRQCVTIYISDFDYPDEKNNLQKSQGNQLILKNIQPQKEYFLSIKAKQDCPYSIVISSSKLPISKLKRGVNSHLTLKAGEIKFFMIQHLQKKQFKILSILKYGQTMFAMNKTTLSNIQKIISSQSFQVKHQNFEIKSEYSNRIVMHLNNQYLSENSFYLIAVEAKSDTQGYIFYGDSLTNIQIVQEATINDQLTLLNQVFTGEYYGDGQISLQVNVLSGQLHTQVKTSAGKQILTKNFAANKKPYTTIFKIQSDGTSFFLKDPMIVSFLAAKQNTVYSFKFKRHQSSQQKLAKTLKQIKTGHPNYLYLEKQYQNYTLTGTFTHKEQLFLTAPMRLKGQLQKLQLTGYLNGIQNQIQISIVRNILKIMFKNIHQGIQKFKLTLRTKIDISLTVYQNYGLSLLAQDTEVLIEGTNDYVLYPEGSVLLDVFQCKGTSNVMFSRSKPQGDKTDAKPLSMDQMPNQPHAIKIMNPGTTFLRIQSTKAFARWLPMNSQTQQGMGYLNYDIGTISYQGSLLKITVQWDSVHSKRETKTLIQKVQYVLIIGQKVQTVKCAINCQNYDDQKLLYFFYNSKDSSVNSKKLSIDLDKFDIVKKYTENQNLFIGLVANVQISIPNKKQQNIQHYRFIYPSQQIPLQVFKSYEVSSKDYWLIGLVGSGILFLLISTLYICFKKIIPLISRLAQGNALVQQTKDQKEFDVIPASSDRNQRQIQNIETQDNMK